jgi:hypothetical protein
MTIQKAIIVHLAEILAAVFEIRASALGSVVGMDETANPILGSVIISMEPMSSICLVPVNLSPYDTLGKRVAVRIETCPHAEHSAVRPCPITFSTLYQFFSPHTSGPEDGRYVCHSGT